MIPRDEGRRSGSDVAPAEGSGHPLPTNEGTDTAQGGRIPEATRYRLRQSAPAPLAGQVRRGDCSASPTSPPSLVREVGGVLRRDPLGALRTLIEYGKVRHAGSVERNTLRRVCAP